MGEGANVAALSLLFAQRSRMTKTPALPALSGLGGRVGGGDRAGAEKSQIDSPNRDI